ncbi:bifunctional PTS fructose transporter subunit IIA/HPr protein [Photobacterium jeanii]|uniref:Multiphosphoryl transfer protein n=1 Tax=Photobacterium jeanii TaxID=858640 RepID=A0A178KM43_9GAMM|nr:fused PTS fructose transporter subunit IIA/HPr protein [Photobacterium jeanii]OAN17743.1 bifunctional PTS fructose transporter subunit IIA/HPr protein [Photobacterium jeanii]PST92595.1 HPr family phosphocarrier protein [Photobacterium jeanii]
MLSLTTTDIQLAQRADNKEQAIKALAAELEQAGLVETGYVNGMLAREAQNSTFLGNGIAIPHGTTDTRGLVKTTGVKLHHFPQGVNWGDGKTVYLAIGIAAKSDEHLGILKQLTKVLSADGVEQQLQACKTEEAIIALLNGEAQLEAEFTAEQVQLGFPATDMLQLNAVAAGLLKNKGLLGNEGVASVVASEPTHLGQGLWLASTSQAVSKTAMAFVTPQNSFEYQAQPVKGVLLVAACNSAHTANLGFLSQLLYSQQADKLFTADAAKVVSLLSEETLDGAEAVFQIKNPHGLHARPGAMLVSKAKSFSANILVANLDGDGKAVNAKSLMKVIALGVKCGHKLQFTAQGDDAEQALAAIGEAIAAGLGEGK